MKIGMVLTPLSDENLRLACQIGVTDIVARYPGTDIDELVRLRDRIGAAGLRLSVIEGFLPIEQIKLGKPGRDDEINKIKKLIRNMGECGVPMLCYNFIPAGDWARTSFDIPERGGALVSEFDLDQMDADDSSEHGSHTDQKMWAYLEYFLTAVVPLAADAGVKLAMHPDDPPVPKFMGLHRIMGTVSGFDRMLEIMPSPSNGICFCQGTFKSMGVDVIDTIHHFKDHIHFVHFRDVAGAVPRFRETFHDNGPTDMYTAMKAYRQIGFQGVIRPDHVPRLEGEEEGEDGYTMLGRLHAVGYMRGLVDAMNSAGE